LRIFEKGDGEDESVEHLPLEVGKSKFLNESDLRLTNGFEARLASDARTPKGEVEL
jgi:hypothetical protein